ncbi:hypothetical protein B5C34_02140 [Pacificimonas flava]|uniref:Transporter n=2 Tax=Pacificimonas TaxID=1960290 RepID=A0A219B203_9SPHN|nr:MULTISPECIES: DUF502 domain-containing protein [Pacificimonas]MBZ6377981.1 DUF502 domain-containing protein [Pacificimonas aurantium]OWV32371.1 hypothetical protein B5C34_02140 [Pacificimonas flava]
MNKFRDPLKPPRRAPWRNSLDRHVGTFLTGLLFLLPIIITLMVLDWVVRQVAGLFGEDTILGSAIFGSSSLLFGDNVLGVWIMLALVVAGIWFVGRIFQREAQRSVQDRIESWVSRIPIIGSIYRPISQLTRMFGMREESELASMRPISCRFGGKDGVDVLALLASNTPVEVAGEPRMLVYMPSAPLPMTGALILVPPESVVRIDGIGVDDLLSYYISLGTVVPEGLSSMQLAPPEKAEDIVRRSQAEPGTGSGPNTQAGPS